MRPKTISASALLVYSGCPSRFYEEYVNRARDSSNSAADLGTVLHAVLEEWVKREHHHPTAQTKFTTMQALYVTEYFKLFSDTERYEEGLEILENWYNRQDFWERTVVSTESKEKFMLPVTYPDGTTGELQFTYIMDRLDMRDDGIPEVVDYKSIRAAVQPEDLKHKIQPRAYAVAAQLKYPDAEFVWVGYDLLRYQYVSVRFSKDENRTTYMHLREVAQRIIDDEPKGTEGEIWPAETINEDCRYCIRKAVCKTLHTHTAAGGLAGVNLSNEPEKIGEVVDARSQAKWQMDALKLLVEEYDNMVTDYMQDEDIRELEGNESLVVIKGRSTRKADDAMIKRIVGPEVWADYSTAGIKSIDSMVKTDQRLTDEQRSEIKKYIKKQPAGRYLQSKSLSDFEDD
jgi:RecB family exonuclease